MKCNRFQLLLSLTCILANGITLVGLVCKKVLHQLTFYPVLIQSICDLTSVGVFGMCVWIDNFFDLEANFISESGLIKDLHKTWSKAVNTFGWRCFLSAGSEHINEYGTGPCMLVIAIDRYLNVFHPHEVKRGRLRKVSIGLNIILTCVVLAFIGLFTFYTFKGNFFQIFCWEEKLAEIKIGNLIFKKRQNQQFRRTKVVFSNRFDMDYVKRICS